MNLNAAPSAGLALKPEHYAEALAAPADGLWFEVHAENYMVRGGPRLAWLEAISERHPLSLHGVGLSLAADVDLEHLARLAELTRRFEPWLVSEHLAWSAWRGAYYPDLLPFPRTSAALARIVDNVERVQDALGRAIAIENPSHYLALEGQEWDEIDFLAPQPGGQLADGKIVIGVNNVFVSARNLGASAEATIDAFPGELVNEIHLAGHSVDGALLIDSHDAPVAPEVWALYERLIARIGARPTLIERDGNLPAFSVLAAEWARAQAVLRAPALKQAA